MKLLILLALFVSIANAEVLVKNGQGDFQILKGSFKMSEILSDFARLEGLNLSVDSAFRDAEFQTQGNMTFKKDQIENYISVLLSQSGNAVIKTPNSPLYKVIQDRDSRFTTGTVYTDPKDIPHNDNQAHFVYRLKHIDASALARNLRPFLERYGRVIDVKTSNTIHITGTGNNLGRLVKLVMMIDTEEFKKSTEEIQAINEKHKKILKSEKSFLEIFVANSGLFVLGFFLIGSIIGFGARGYMMKKVEGGW